MAEKIFMSYAPKDRSTAKSVEKILRKQGLVEAGPSTILDPQRRLKARANVRKAIQQQMEAATKVVVIASEDGEQSQWVNYEVGLADALGKPILVVKRKKGRMSDEFSQRLGALANMQSIEIE